MEMVYTLAEINSVVNQVWASGEQYKVWAFNGEMGTGKTTFIAALCLYLGIDTGISSPTYSIINTYKSTLAGIIYHTDLYRLAGEEEAIEAGVEEILYSGSLCLVEWPGKAPGLMPADVFTLNFSVTGPSERKIEWVNSA